MGVTEAIGELMARAPVSQQLRVAGSVELFVPHFPCCSCTGAVVQFCTRYPCVKVRVGHDDWRHWSRRLRELWDPMDARHHQLSINGRQLRELDSDLVGSIPEAYRKAIHRETGAAWPAL